MKSYEDTIFDMEISIDKNSKEFDLSLLEELKQLKDIPVNKFDSLVRKIMRKKSSCKLWFDNKTVTERWDGKEMRKTNYRCCPTSRKAYLNNPITEAVVMQGLEPFDSWSDLLLFIEKFREKSQDDIVIYTGYYKEEIADKINILKRYDNIVVKFGRFLPGHKKHYDEVLGVELASPNQYAEVIS